MEAGITVENLVALVKELVKKGENYENRNTTKQPYHNARKEDLDRCDKPVDIFGDAGKVDAIDIED